MSVLGRILKAASSYAGLTFPRAQSWWFSWADVSASEHIRSVGDGLESNVLTTPILWIGKAFSEARVGVRVLQPDGEVEKDLGHPMARLLARPNPCYSAPALWVATLLSYLTAGESYWQKVRGRKGEVVELWYLPHWLVEPVGTTSELITHYLYRPTGAAIRIEPSEIIHLRYGINPKDMRHGYSPLASILREVFTDDEAARLVSALLRNKGIPGMLISPEKDVVVDEQDAEAMKAYVAEKFTGLNRGKPMVLRGATKVQTFGFSPAELDLSALRNVSEERVCAALGIPPAVVGFGTGLEDSKVGATMREYVKLAWVSGLRPIQRMMAADMTLQLLPDFDKNPRAEVCFDDSEVEALQPDRLQAAQAGRVELEGGIATRGEVRKRLGYEVTDADDVFYIPFSTTPTPREADAIEPEEPAPGEDLEAEAGAKAAKALTRRQAALMRARDASAKRHRTAFEAKLMAFFKRLGAEAAHLFREASKDTDDEARIDRLFRELNIPKHKRALMAMFGEEYVAIHNDQVKILTELGVGVNLPDTAQIEFLRMGSARAQRMDLSEAAKERMREILALSRDAGRGIDEIANELERAIPAGRFLEPRTRALLIARTEVREAQTRSALRTYEAIDGVTQVMIIDARLGETDAECEQINGTVMSFGQAAATLAAEHPNGTRDVVPVF